MILEYRKLLFGIFNREIENIRKCVKFIPKLLTAEQKNVRLEIAQDNLHMILKPNNILGGSFHSWATVR